MDAHQLRGMEFIIPLFNAQHQKYICDDVRMEHTSSGRNYQIFFDIIKEYYYHVPDRLELILEFRNSFINCKLFDVTGRGINELITDFTMASDVLQSVAQLKTFLQVLGNKSNQ